MSTRLAYVAAHAAAAALSPLAAAGVAHAAAVVFPVNQGGNGNAYEVVLDAGESIDAARASAAASSQGGHLATITSAAEQSFVESLLAATGAPTGSYWLDLRRGDGDTFAWGTGEPFDFANFAGGEPNNFMGTEAAGQLYWSADPVDDLVGRSGTWNDAAPLGYPNPTNPSFPTPDLSRAGFILEVEAAAVPLPAAVVAAPLTALLAAGVARRMRRARD